MCAIDDADYFCEVLSSRTLTARKAHRCNECGRTIEPGESYLCEFLTDKEQGARVHKTCAHCQIVREWLLRECGGWLYSGIAEDIGDHAGYGMPVARLVVGINRQWYRIDGSLMPVPTLPQGGRMTDLEMVKLAAKAAELDAESAAAPFGDEAEAEKAERGIAPLLNVLRLEARYAEWRDKEIHPVNGPAFQAWILEIQLPVPLDEPDKSPEAALNRWLASVGVQ